MEDHCTCLTLFWGVFVVEENRKPPLKGHVEREKKWNKYKTYQHGGKFGSPILGHVVVLFGHLETPIQEVCKQHGTNMGIECASECGLWFYGVQASHNLRPGGLIPETVSPCCQVSISLPLAARDELRRVGRSWLSRTAETEVVFFCNCDLQEVWLGYADLKKSWMILTCYVIVMFMIGFS